MERGGRGEKVAFDSAISKRRVTGREGVGGAKGAEEGAGGQRWSRKGGVEGDGEEWRLARGEWKRGRGWWCREGLDVDYVRNKGQSLIK